MWFREKQQIAICIVAGAILCVFMLFWYLPLQRKIKTVKQTKTAQTLTIAKGTADGKQLPLLEEQLLTMKNELGNYELKIPEQRALGEFLSKIADLMNEYNLREQVIAPLEEIKAEEINCIPVNIQCKGNLQQIFRFYRQLQDLDRLVRIERVKLLNDSDFTGGVRSETKAIIYYRADLG